MWQATIVIIILVQIVQFIGDLLVKTITNKRTRA